MEAGMSATARTAATIHAAFEEWTGDELAGGAGGVARYSSMARRASPISRRRLRGSRCRQRRNSGQRPGWIVEQRMVYRFVILAPDTKAEEPPHVIHDVHDIAAHLAGGRIRADGLVAAGDVIADAGRADAVFIRHHAADRHGVTFVMVGHERHLVGCPRAVLNLRERAFIYGRTPHRNSVYYLHWLGLSPG